MRYTRAAEPKASNPRRFTTADIGRVIGFLPQSSFEQTELESPSGDYTVCPNCNGSGKHRIDFINRQPKTINGHTFLRGVNMEYRECGRCEGSGEVWVEDK